MPPPDANSGQPPTAAKHNFSRRIRVGVWLIASIWFAWFAYAHWTTPSAAQIHPRWSLGPRGLPAELDVLIKAVPAPPPTTMPAIPRAGGLFFPGDASYVMTGPWDTAGRTDLARLAGHVAGPTVQPSLDVLSVWLNDYSPADIANLPRPDIDPNSVNAFAGPPNPLSEVATALLFRARQAAIERKDYASAWRDLRALLRIHIAGRGTMVAYAVPESLVLFELGCLAQEVALPPELAREMIAAIRDELGLSVVSAAEHLGLVPADMNEILDGWYSDDGHGDGWLVLTAVAHSFPSYTGKRLSPRSGAWNLLSPLYYGRATMRARLAAWIDEARAWDELDLTTAAAQIERRRKSPDAASVFDGVTMLIMSGRDRTVGFAYDTATMRRAAVVLLALSAHRHMNNSYPEELEELVPSLLDQVPIDPIAALPFEYLLEGDGFVLPQTKMRESHPAFYGSMLNDPRFPLCEGTYQPTRDPKP